MTVFNLYIYELLGAAMKAGDITIEGTKPKHEYNTRHTFHNNDCSASVIGYQTPKNCSIKIFNCLSHDLICTFKDEGPISFRRKLKSKLLKKPYYSLQEFFADPV